MYLLIEYTFKPPESYTILIGLCRILTSAKKLARNRTVSLHFFEALIEIDKGRGLAASLWSYHLELFCLIEDWK